MSYIEIDFYEKIFFLVLSTSCSQRI